MRTLGLGDKNSLRSAQQWPQETATLGRAGINANNNELLGVGTGLEAALIRKLNVFFRLEEGHVRCLRDLQKRHETHAQQTDLIRMGDPFTNVYVLLNGWAMRYKLLPDGRRQVIGFVLPGDFICLNACVLQRAEYTVTLLTEAKVAVVDVPQMFDMARNHPGLNAAILWCNAREESILMERLVSLGRRSAYERTAHILLELCRRLQLLGLAQNNRFHFPVTQQLLSDVLGLSTVHVNRTLRRMQSDGLIRVLTNKGMEMDIRDYDELCHVAGFDDGYLHFTEMPAQARRAVEHACH